MPAVWFEESWTCSNGHVNEGGAMYAGGGDFLCSSVFHACDHCSEIPSEEERERFMGSLTAQAISQGVIVLAADGTLPR